MKKNMVFAVLLFLCGVFSFAEVSDAKTKVLTENKETFVYNSVYIVPVEGKLYLEALKKARRGQYSLPSGYVDFDFRGGNANKNAAPETLKFNFNLILEDSGKIFLEIIPQTKSGYLPPAKIYAKEEVVFSKGVLYLGVFFQFDQDKTRIYMFTPLKADLDSYK